MKNLSLKAVAGLFMVCALMGCASSRNFISDEGPLRFIGEYDVSQEVLFRATEEAFISEGYGIVARDTERFRLVANQGFTFRFLQSGTWGRYILAVIEPWRGDKTRLMITTKQKLIIEPSFDTIDRELDIAVSKRIKALRVVGEIE